MVKSKRTGRSLARQAAAKEPAKRGEARQGRITPETPYAECSERLTTFGGLLALVKFLDLIGFEKMFAEHCVHPKGEPKLGGYRMVLGMLMLLFIGFQRPGHFSYVQCDAMICSVMRVGVLPAVRPFRGPQPQPSQPSGQAIPTAMSSLFT